MIYKCDKCGEYFTEDEADEKNVDIEAEYGVGGEFPDHHFRTILVCPSCHSGEICEYEPDEDEICELLNEEEERECRARAKKI